MDIKNDIKKQIAEIEDTIWLVEKNIDRLLVMEVSDKKKHYWELTDILGELIKHKVRLQDVSKMM